MRLLRVLTLAAAVVASACGGLTTAPTSVSAPATITIQATTVTGSADGAPTTVTSGAGLPVSVAYSLDAGAGQASFLVCLSGQPGRLDGTCTGTGGDVASLGNPVHLTLLTARGCNVGWSTETTYHYIHTFVFRGLRQATTDQELPADALSRTVRELTVRVVYPQCA